MDEQKMMPGMQNTKEGCWNVCQAHRIQAGKQERDEGQKGGSKV